MNTKVVKNKHKTKSIPPKPIFCAKSILMQSIGVRKEPECCEKQKHEVLLRGCGMSEQE
jgi:hypothetical protein